MRSHWGYIAVAIGLMGAGQGIAAAASSLLPSLIGLVGGTACILVAMFHATDPDPALGRVAVSVDEAALAAERLRWLDEVVAQIAGCAQVKPLRATAWANAGIYYKPLGHRICISRALCARLSDADLRLIVAHEIGHATRRYATWTAWSESARIAEEIRADRMALRLIGASKGDWRHAMVAALQAEGHDGRPEELAARWAAIAEVDEA